MKVLLLCLITVVVISCSATITRTDGTKARGRIATSDTNNVYLQSRGTETAVERKQIASVDHPGNVLGNIGLAVVGVGGLQVMVGYDCKDAKPDCSSADSTSNEEGDFLMTQGFIYIGAGIIAAIVGYSTWFGSVSRFKPAAFSQSNLRLNYENHFVRGEVIHRASMHYLL